MDECKPLPSSAPAGPAPFMTSAAWYSDCSAAARASDPGAGSVGVFVDQYCVLAGVFVSVLGVLVGVSLGVLVILVDVLGVLGVLRVAQMLSR